MTTAEKGRHCESCEKEVIDFTNMSDRELLNLLANTSGNLCGRFKTIQLNRQFSLQKSEVSSSQWAKIGLLAANLLMVVPAAGQEKPTESDPVEQRVIAQSEYWDLKGKVVNEEGEPLAGASILLQGRSTGTVSDLDGEFVVSIHYYDRRMWVSYMGYSTQEILLDDKSLRNLIVVLQKGVKL
ncbi:MAG: carboxypeptidase-like regulatory domain-containing protein [Saprospiraceae bacterium]|nr:carboxypeptidase-like regulatory domain-containing protein [Saprospiraceae bacterium]